VHGEISSASRAKVVRYIFPEDMSNITWLE